MKTKTSSPVKAKRSATAQLPANIIVRGVLSIVIVMVVIRASNNSVFALLTIGLLGHDVQAQFLFQ